MGKTCILILVAMLLLSCNRGSEKKTNGLNSQIVESSFALDDVELHALINGLLEGDSIKVDLVILQTSDVRKLRSYLITEAGDTVIDDSIPALPWEFRYNKGDFNALVKQGLIDSTEAEYMFESITPNLIVTLDTAQLVRRGIDFEKLDKFFTDRNREVGFNKLEKELGARSFVRLSTPLLNKSKTKVLISMNSHCGRLCGSGTMYLLEKVNGKWKVIHKEVTFIS